MKLYSERDLNEQLDRLYLTPKQKDNVRHLIENITDRYSNQIEKCVVVRIVNIVCLQKIISSNVVKNVKLILIFVINGRRQKNENIHQRANHPRPKLQNPL